MARKSRAIFTALSLGLDVLPDEYQRPVIHKALIDKKVDLPLEAHLGGFVEEASLLDPAPGIHAEAILHQRLLN